MESLLQVRLLFKVWLIPIRLLERLPFLLSLTKGRNVETIKQFVSCFNKFGCFLGCITKRKS